ncbi:MAG: tetratricopeptide repeat protein [Planctomycetia bacterium]|nr:tetratricopeptide repeat protein [Planctomycetia bacterium]
MATNEELYSEAERLKDQGKLDEAATMLERLVEQDPKYALAHSALAVIYGRLKRHDDAIRARMLQGRG